MAKRSLGEHWAQRTPAERGEFVRLFTELVQRSYVSRVDQHGADKMTLQGEKLDGDYAGCTARPTAGRCTTSAWMGSASWRTTGHSPLRREGRTMIVTPER